MSLREPNSYLLSTFNSQYCSSCGDPFSIESFKRHICWKLDRMAESASEMYGRLVASFDVEKSFKQYSQLSNEALVAMIKLNNGHIVTYKNIAMGDSGYEDSSPYSLVLRIPKKKNTCLFPLFTLGTNSIKPSTKSGSAELDLDKYAAYGPEQAEGFCFFGGKAMNCGSAHKSCDIVRACLLAADISCLFFIFYTMIHDKVARDKANARARNKTQKSLLTPPNLMMHMLPSEWVCRGQESLYVKAFGNTMILYNSDEIDMMSAQSHRFSNLFVAGTSEDYDQAGEIQVSKGSGEMRGSVFRESNFDTVAACRIDFVEQQSTFLTNYSLISPDTPLAVLKIEPKQITLDSPQDLNFQHLKIKQPNNGGEKIVTSLKTLIKCMGFGFGTIGDEEEEFYFISPLKSAIYSNKRIMLRNLISKIPAFGELVEIAQPANELAKSVCWHSYYAAPYVEELSCVSMPEEELETNLLELVDAFKSKNLKISSMRLEDDMLKLGSDTSISYWEKRKKSCSRLRNIVLESYDYDDPEAAVSALINTEGAKRPNSGSVEETLPSNISDALEPASKNLKKF